MKTYTEKELLKAIEYACGYQKGSDYQLAGRYLLNEFESVKQADTASELLLDELSGNTNSSKEITIDEINEYLKTK